MSEPFLGEVKMFGFSAPPRGWMPCDGRLLPINQNQALFAILGTTYGGNGVNTFALPDLRGSVPVQQGNGISLGESAGEEAHTLTQAEMPAHTHLLYCNEGEGNDKVASGNTWAKNAINPYGTTVDSTMSSQALGQSGQGQAHTNMQPYVVTNYCIAVQGIFPPRN
ncbi:phage tail protein [Brevibacillus fluminis]|uniref:Phage tail protein n=1 Tax=Brevibacillus fluminis TaxID=511487 RepID=A0A3M8DN30_9BACL|nr:tail fiber protein [Brevibacillus fluminis]RNB89478.1 phage tail protein [Brevibacillus fluminis]